MDIIALIAALSGLSIVVLGVFFGSKVANRWLRYLLVLTSVLVAIVVFSIIPLLFDAPLRTSERAGAYTFYLGLVLVIVKLVFFRKKNITSNNS